MLKKLFLSFFLLLSTVVNSLTCKINNPYVIYTENAVSIYPDLKAAYVLVCLGLCLTLLFFFISIFFRKNKFLILIMGLFTFLALALTSVGVHIIVNAKTPLISLNKNGVEKDRNVLMWNDIEVVKISAQDLPLIDPRRIYPQPCIFSVVFIPKQTATGKNRSISISDSFLPITLMELLELIKEFGNFVHIDKTCLTVNNESNV